jgi:hypothetical protein
MSSYKDCAVCAGSAVLTITALTFLALWVFI